MKRLVWKVLFETRFGDRLLGRMERVLGLGIVPVETLDEASQVLVDAASAAIEAVSAA